jgi:hypothetical protein
MDKKNYLLICLIIMILSLTLYYLDFETSLSPLIFAGAIVLGFVKMSEL